MDGHQRGNKMKIQETLDFIKRRAQEARMSRRMSMLTKAAERQIDVEDFVKDFIKRNSAPVAQDPLVDEILRRFQDQGVDKQMAKGIIADMIQKREIRKTGNKLTV